MSEKFRLDRKIGFQNTFYTKCINIIIDSIGPSIILRSIHFLSVIVNHVFITYKSGLIHSKRGNSDQINTHFDLRIEHRKTL